MNGLHMYRINAVIGDDIVLHHERGWNGLDAMQRLSKRLINEGQTLFTLSILDKKEVE